MCVHKFAVFSSSCMAAALPLIRQTSGPHLQQSETSPNKLTDICSDSSHVLLNHSRSPSSSWTPDGAFIWQWGQCASQWCHFLWQSAHDTPAGLKMVTMERRGDKSPRCAYTGTVTGRHLWLLLQTHWRDTPTSFLSYYLITTLSPKQQWCTCTVCYFRETTNPPVPVASVHPSIRACNQSASFYTAKSQKIRSVSVPPYQGQEVCCTCVHLKPTLIQWHTRISDKNLQNMIQDFKSPSGCHDLLPTGFFKTVSDCMTPDLIQTPLFVMTRSMLQFSPRLILFVFTFPLVSDLLSLSMSVCPPPSLSSPALITFTYFLCVCVYIPCVSPVQCQFVFASVHSVQAFCS